MRTLFAAALGSALLMSGGVLAQATSPDQPGSMSPGATGSEASPQVGDTAPGALGDTISDPQLGMAGEARSVVGKQIQDLQGEQIGEITNVLIGQDGRVQALVVEHEDEQKRLDWQRVTMTQDGEIETTAEVAELPDYEEDDHSQ